METRDCITTLIYNRSLPDDIRKYYTIWSRTHNNDTLVYGSQSRPKLIVIYYEPSGRNQIGADYVVSSIEELIHVLDQYTDCGPWLHEIVPWAVLDYRDQTNDSHPIVPGEVAINYDIGPMWYDADGCPCGPEKAAIFIHPKGVK